MNNTNRDFARKLLVIIISISIASLVYVFYFQNPTKLKSGKNTLKKTLTTEQKAEKLKMAQTSNRLQQYIYFFEKNEKEIRLLETSASVNLTTDLKLNKPYLKDLLDR